MSKKILIAGGSSGLGRAMAEKYAASGSFVGVIARRTDLLQELQTRFPHNIITLNADVSHANFEQQLTGLIEKLGGIDILIAMASVIELDTDILPGSGSKTIDINVSGFLKCINAGWNHFKQKGGGQLVGVTSVAAARGNKAAPSYHASKAFQSLYLQSLQVKAAYEKNNITVTELVPGYMKTNMAKNDRQFWVSPVDKAAKQAIKAIERKRKRAFITKRWWLIYQVYRFLPSFIYYRIVNSGIRFQKNTAHS